MMSTGFQEKMNWTDHLLGNICSTLFWLVSQLVSSSSKHLFTTISATLMNMVCFPLDLWMVGTFSQQENTKKQNKTKLNGHLNGLTYDHGVWAVPLGVLLALPHAAGAGLCLVGAQGLPLTLQTVLVLQVVLHVRLEDNTDHLSSHFKGRAKTMQQKTNLSLNVSVFATNVWLKKEREREIIHSYFIRAGWR